MLTVAEQVAHIEEHQDLFDELMGEPRSVQEYFQEYNTKFERADGPGGLYLRLCADLDLVPKDF